jgi:hypothetical protein
MTYLSFHKQVPWHNWLARHTNKLPHFKWYYQCEGSEFKPQWDHLNTFFFSSFIFLTEGVFLGAWMARGAVCAFHCLWWEEGVGEGKGKGWRGLMLQSIARRGFFVD